MFRRLVRAALPLLILAVLLPAGCRRTAGTPASPEKARETLKQGLDAWKSGQTPDALQSSASIVFADTHWQGGAKLVSYEVQGDGESDGFDWQCRVKLSLVDAKGNKSEQRAIYNINTSPKLVVVRMEF